MHNLSTHSGDLDLKKTDYCAIYTTFEIGIHNLEIKAIYLHPSQITAITVDSVEPLAQI